ncbi:hypothetical protein SB2_28045 [Methylobacterium radiotolerans]|nr:hypothetical protein SB3_29510 [Methylobacterium radiotolerans]KTS43410.1 hypothetical protein SB2_28045 [Methylobacterium radiotolerans]
MQALRYDFTIRRGDSETLSIFVKSRDVFTNEVKAVDLSGATVTWTVKRAGGADIVKRSDHAGDLTTDLPDGRVTWDLSPDDTTAFSDDASPYTVRVSDASGRSSTYLEGFILAEG